ncbi:MAG TPA: twin-arginine translocation signal domain-containing protein [Steroidobacteraceae bacterium]|nr:twin-arginine translocation signal domain-containing protein [Steroidobacteraceae bacterium]
MNRKRTARLAGDAAFQGEPGMANNHETPNHRGYPATRRRFLAQAGAAGALALGGGWIRPAHGAQAMRFVTSGLIGLELDGAFAGHLSGFSGGIVAGDVVVEKPGADLVQRKHVGNPRIEPIIIETSQAPTGPFYDWIKSSLQPQAAFPRKSGAVIEFDATGQEVRRHNFSNATIVAVEFPSCDSARREVSSLAVSLAPEHVSHTGGTDKGGYSAAAKNGRLMQSAFRLRIMGLEQATVRASRIDAFGVKIVSASAGDAGYARDYTRQPSTVATSHLVVTIPDAFAAPLYAWHDDFVVRGNNSQDKERPGLLEYLAPDLQTALLTVNLFNLGIFRISPESAEQAGGEGMAFSRMEMYCESVSIGTAMEADARRLEPARLRRD